MKAININGTVKKYGKLPTSWKDETHNIVNFRKASIELLEEIGFFDVENPTITEHQRLGALLPEHFDTQGKVWIPPVINFTQVEIDSHDEAVLDSDETAMEDEQRESDGILLFKRIRRRVKRMFDRGGLQPTQIRKLRKELYPILKGLKDGDWDFVQEDLTAMPDYTNVKLLGIQTIARDKVDAYVLENYS
jgi:hypothetical protein